MDIGKFLATGGGGGGRKRRSGGGGAHREDHSAQDKLRDEYQFAQELGRADLDILRAKQDLAKDYVARTSLSIEIKDKEREAYYAELAYNVALNGLTKGKEGMTQAQAGQLKALYDSKDALERQAILDEEQARRAEDVQKLTQGDFDRQRELLQSREAIATTASERRKIELELLRLAYEQKRQALQNIIDTSKDDAEKEQARRDLAGLNATYSNDQQAVINQTRNPLEEWAAHVPKTRDEIIEAMQEIEARGIDGLAQAITGVITGTESLKDAFHDLAASILAELIQMTIKMAIFRALSAAMGGSFGGGMSAGGGSIAGFSGGAPGFARGGSFSVLGRRGVDRNMLALNGIPIARVSHGERISVGNDNEAGAAMPAVHINIDATGADPAALDRVRMELRNLETTLPAKVIGAYSEARSRFVIRK